MSRLVLSLVVLSFAACAAPTTFTNGGADVPADPGTSYTFAFDDDDVGALPSTFSAALGEWSVVDDTTAPSGGRALRQAGAFADPDYPRVLVNNLVFGDATARVSCQLLSGDIDQACGIMFRATDSENYYLTRANALEDNVRLYHVVGGARVQLATADLDVTAGAWHTLEVTAAGAAFAVRWDGEMVLNASDDTFASGKIGLWTKADSVTSFDDLSADASP